jgi:hypothetical protein
VQVVCPAAEYVPAGQITGATAGFEQLYPAGHWICELEPAAEKYPIVSRINVPALSNE